MVNWNPSLPDPSRLLSLPALHRPLVTAADAGPAPRLLVATGRPPLTAESLLYWRESDGETLVPGALCLTPFYERAEPLPHGQRRGS